MPLFSRAEFSCMQVLPFQFCCASSGSEVCSLHAGQWMVSSKGCCRVFLAWKLKSCDCFKVCLCLQETDTNRPLLRPNNYATTSRRTVTTDINGHTILNSGEVRQHDSCWVMLLHCLQGDANYRIFKASSKSGTLSVSKIDSLARIIFPFSFTCLNVLYWAGFLYYF